MRRLLEYTRTGRWMTLTAAESPAVQAGPEEKLVDAKTCEPENQPAVQVQVGVFSSARRLLEYTISGHWRIPGEDPSDAAPAVEERQFLADSAFFGLEVKEIPVEKWREIAPLFGR